MARARGVYIETEMFGSKAYKLLTKKDMRIYFEFLLKRRFREYKGKKGKSKKRWDIVNNGIITFTYAEAERLGYPRPTFQRALDKLISVGLIDITYQGIGGMVSENGKIKGEPSLFAISERWKDYGTDNFVKKKRKKDTRKGRGWAVYHARKRKEKK